MNVCSDCLSGTGNVLSVDDANDADVVNGTIEGDVGILVSSADSAVTDAAVIDSGSAVSASVFID